MKQQSGVSYTTVDQTYFEKRGLRRYAGVWSLWALGVGAVISGHFSGWNFGLVFVLVNLPFYWLAVRRMGWEFTLKTFAAVTACGLLTDLLPRWMEFARMSQLFAALVGGALSGRKPVQSATQSGASRRNGLVPKASGSAIRRLPP